MSKIQLVDTPHFKDAVKQGESTENTGVRKQFIAEKIEVLSDDPEGKSVGEPSRRVRFTISTGSPDRHGDTVSPTGWDLKWYKQNPVVLFAHDNSTPPIGKANNIKVEGKQALKATCDFLSPSMFEGAGSEHDHVKFSDMLFQMVKGGFLKATSVGFLPTEWDLTEDENRRSRMGIDFMKQQLLEFSMVPVPANPEALVDAQKSGIDVSPLDDYFENALENWANFRDMLVVPRKHVEKLSKTLHGNRSQTGYDPDKLAQKNIDSAKQQSEPEKGSGMLEVLSDDYKNLQDKSMVFETLVGDRIDELGLEDDSVVAAVNAGTDLGENGAKEFLAGKRAGTDDAFKTLSEQLQVSEDVLKEAAQLSGIEAKQEQQVDSANEEEDEDLGEFEEDDAKGKSQTEEHSGNSEEKTTVTDDVAKTAEQIHLRRVGEEEVYADGTPEVIRVDDEVDLGDVVELVGDTLTLTLSDQIVTYGYEGAIDDNVSAYSLKGVEPRMAVPYGKAHPEGTSIANRFAEFDLKAEGEHATVQMAAALDADDQPTLIHHFSGEQMALSKIGVTSAMAKLMAGQPDNLSEKDIRGAYDHLAKHYSELGLTAPEFELVSEQVLADAESGYIFDNGTGKLMKMDQSDEISKYVTVGEKQEDSFEVQTLVFPKKKDWTADSAKKWAKDHGFKASKVDETNTSFRLRQREPGEFRRLRTICVNPGDESASSENCKVQAVGGPRKKDVSVESPAKTADTVKATVERQFGDITEKATFEARTTEELNKLIADWRGVASTPNNGNNGNGEYDILQLEDEDTKGEELDIDSSHVREIVQEELGSVVREVLSETIGSAKGRVD